MIARYCQVELRTLFLGNFHIFFGAANELVSKNKSICDCLLLGTGASPQRNPIEPWNSTAPGTTRFSGMALLACRACAPCGPTSHERLEQFRGEVAFHAVRKHRHDLCS